VCLSACLSVCVCVRACLPVGGVGASPLIRWVGGVPLRLCVSLSHTHTHSVCLYRHWRQPDGCVDKKARPRPRLIVASGAHIAPSVCLCLCLYLYLCPCLCASLSLSLCVPVLCACVPVCLCRACACAPLSLSVSLCMDRVGPADSMFAGVYHGKQVHAGTVRWSNCVYLSLSLCVSVCIHM
jgi:hypothetical protein